MKLQSSQNSKDRSVLNMRKSAADSSAVEVVGNIVRDIDKPYSHLLTLTTSDGGETDFYTNGLDLYWKVETGELQFIAALSSTPYYSLGFSDTEIAVFCSESMVKVVCRNGEWTLLDEEDQGPEANFGVSPVSMVGGTMEGLRLSRDYSTHDTKLEVADAKRLYKNYLDAELRCRANSGALSKSIHPRIVRYKAVSAEGEILFIGAPALLFPTAGTIVNRRFSISGARIPETEVWRDVWQPLLDLHQISGLTDVDHLIIESTPQLDPADRGSLPDMIVGTAPDGTLQVNMQPADYTAEAYRRYLTAAIGHLDSLLKPVCRIEKPFSAPSVVVPEFSDDTSDINDEIRRLRKKIFSKPSESNHLKNMLSSPNGLTFTAAAVNGEVTLAANPSVIRFKGFCPSDFAVSSTGGAWKGYCRVTFSDGTSVVSHEEAAGNCPTALSPLLSYPSADAVSMTVAIAPAGGGGVWKREFPLKPTVSGNCSFYLAPSLETVDTTDMSADTDYIVPASTASPVAFPGVLLTFVSGISGGPVDIRRECDRTIQSIVACRAGSVGLEGRSRRYYAAGVNGTRLVTVDKSGKISSVLLVDNCPVVSPECVVALGDGEAAVLTSVGKLKFLRGNSVRKSVDAEGSALAFDPKHNELWVLAGDNSACHVYSLNGAGWYRRTLPAPFAGVGHVASGSRLTLADGVCRLGAGEDSETLVEAEYLERVDLRPFSKLRHLLCEFLLLACRVGKVIFKFGSVGEIVAASACNCRRMVVCYPRGEVSTVGVSGMFSPGTLYSGHRIIPCGEKEGKRK